eukprot:scaffold205118_cov18-Tisochrysis_lutea.AAC.1
MMLEWTKNGSPGGLDENWQRRSTPSAEAHSEMKLLSALGRGDFAEVCQLAENDHLYWPRKGWASRGDDPLGVVCDLNEVSDKMLES